MYTLKKSILATFVALGAGMFAYNASAVTVEQEGGTITFQGEILTTACTLTLENETQTVTLADIPTGIFSASGELANMAQPFNIVLEDCDSQLHTQVAMKFTGPGASTVGILDNTGTAVGVGFKVLQNATEVPFDGTAMAPITITDGTMTIPFSADYISTAATQTPGTITSAATFRLSYQ